MVKKRYIQACEVGGSIYGKRTAGKKVSPIHNDKANKKDVADIYNKFYKTQVSALYKAIHGKND